MIPRKQKLIAAGAVLGVGLALALLFRRDAAATTASVAPTTASRSSKPVTPTPLPATAFSGHVSPLTPTPAVNAGLSLGSAPATIVTEPPPALSVVPHDRPVYASSAHETSASSPEISPYRTHVVHNGDTLERLAERYLADGARAVELFDLNRDVLENPHLLPIGAELRVPTGNSAHRD